MKKFTIQMNKRCDLGKGASRRLRRNDLVPGIVYGGSTAPMSVEVSHKALSMLLADPAVMSSIIELECEREQQLVVLRDLQRHPYKARILHFDLQRVDRNQPIVMRVPLHFVGGENAPGVKVSGGIISHAITSVEISCLPERIPEHIEVDLSQLELNQAIHLAQLTLPNGVELANMHTEEQREAMVVSIYLPKDEAEETNVATVDAAAEVPTVAKGKEADEAS